MGLLSRYAHHRVVVLLLLAAGSVVRAQGPSVPLLLPSGLAYDAGGDLYFAETRSHIVRRLSAAGVLGIVAGNGVQGFAGDGGPATSAQLDAPGGVAVDGSGNLFIADTHNHRIRRVDAVTGIISTLAVAGMPVALAVEASGAVVFADAAKQQVLRVAGPGAAPTVVVGLGKQSFGGDGGLATAALLDTPSGLALDAQGNLYLADSHNQRVRRVDAKTGVVTTFAGSGVPGFSGDGAGAAAARLSLPRGLGLDAAGNLYVVDGRNQRIRRVDAATGAISTIAGGSTEGFNGDGIGAAQAQLASPQDVSLSPGGSITVSDSRNNRVRQIIADGTIQTIAGAGAILPAKLGTTATLTQPSSALLQCAVAAASGTPAGVVTLIDAVSPVASLNLSAGLANFPLATLSTGSHTMSCSYAGGAGYLAAVSAPLIVTVGPAAAAGFSLAASGSSAVAVPSGGTASFNFVVMPTGSQLSSEIVLSVVGLPTGAQATFTPAYLPPPSGPVNFTLAVTAPTIKAGLQPKWPLLVLVLPLACSRKRRRWLVLAVVALAGCGDRVSGVVNSASLPAVTYNLTVNATATSAAGAVLQQSVPITLTVE